MDGRAHRHGRHQALPQRVSRHGAPSPDPLQQLAVEGLRPRRPGGAAQLRQGQAEGRLAITLHVSINDRAAD